MYKLRPFIPVNVMKNIYYSLVLYSHIIYAIEIWGSAFKIDLDKISILQKRVVRLMTFNDGIPSTPGPLRQTEPMFVKVKWSLLLLLFIVVIYYCYLLLLLIIVYFVRKERKNE